MIQKSLRHLLTRPDVSRFRNVISQYANLKLNACDRDTIRAVLAEMARQIMFQAIDNNQAGTHSESGYPEHFSTFLFCNLKSVSLRATKNYL